MHLSVVSILNYCNPLRWASLQVNQKKPSGDLKEEAADIEVMKNKVRIIGGQWRSRQLHFIDAPSLRPTPSRVRETLFNWLQDDIPGRRCLDLYAGSGALGFEAASRGAKSVIAVENNLGLPIIKGQCKYIGRKPNKNCQ